MRKRVIMAAFFVLSMCGMAHADVVQTLTVNGQKVERVVSQITFSGDNVVLHFDGTEETYPMDDVQIDFTSGAGIGNISTFKLNAFVDGQLNIAGLAAGTQVAVYDVSGKKLAQAQAEGESTQVNVDNLNSGVYILKAGNQIVKFVKR